MPYSMQQTQTQQPKAAQRQQHAVSKNTYCRDAVLPNEKDEPKMTKARCTLRRRCGYLQCVRDGEGGAAVAAPIKQETKIKIKPNLALAEPPLYKIIYINDNVTSMEFVVGSLIDYFNYNQDTAQSITHNIHEEGSAIVAVLPYEIAEQKGIEVTLDARSQGFPLQVKVEAEA